MIDINTAYEGLKSVMEIKGTDIEKVVVDRAYEYISKRTWNIPAKQIMNKIEEICK